MSRLLLVVAAALTLTGCFDDQRRQLAACDLEAKRSGAYSSSAYGEPWKTVDLCMTAARYEHAEHKECTLGKLTFENPYCYRPMSPSGRRLYEIEMARK